MCKYINGVVMTKTVADRRMQTEFSTPSILIIRNTLEIDQADLQSEMDQEEFLINILSKKLEQIRPSIVLVEHDVTYKVMCMLRDDHKITVVSNIEEHKLQKIARLTQTIKINGVNEIDKRFVLGQCS